jgi:hypothetical protein
MGQILAQEARFPLQSVPISTAAVADGQIASFQLFALPGTQTDV